MKELKEMLKGKDMMFGTDITIKRLKSGELKQVLLAKNCPDNVRNKIKYYAKLGKVSVTELDIKNDELGMICKKPFSVTVLSF